MKWIAVIVLVACSQPAPAPAPPREPPPVPVTRTITILGTNDLHGALERLPLLAGFVANVRAARAADGGGVVLVDAGELQGPRDRTAGAGDRRRGPRAARARRADRRRHRAHRQRLQGSRSSR